MNSLNQSHKKIKQEEINKMLRINACKKLGEHEYELIKQNDKQIISECIHCKNWLLEEK